MTIPELRAKALELAPHGCAMSAAVLRLFGAHDALKAFAEGAADRVHKQGELLTERAGRPAKHPEVIT